MSLIEIIVVMALLSGLLLGTHQLLQSGIRYFNESMDSLEVQKEGLVALSRLSSELQASNFDKIHSDPGPIQGLVFPSIYDASDDFYTDTDGRLMWRSIRCYHRGTLADGTEVLYKKSAALPMGDTSTPPDPYGFASPFTVAFFNTQSADQVVARNVDDFLITMGTDIIEFDLTISLSRKNTSSMTIKTKVTPRN